MKTKIPSLSYNAMFKAVFQNNTYILSRLIQAILDYYNLGIDIKNKELIVKNNELNISNYHDRMLICDYIIKIDEYHELNIEINKSKYIGLSERNLTYSFKIFYEHFNSGDMYTEFNKYTLLQVNFNNFDNPNHKCINKYYLTDSEDIENRLSNNYSIMNIDIAKCHQIVYNKSDLEEISDLIVFGAITYCEYLEDITSILESGLISMDKKEKDKFISDVKRAANDKQVHEDLRMEKTWEIRAKSIEAMIKETAIQEGKKEALEIAKKEVTEQLTKDVTEQVTKDVTEYRTSY